MHLFWLIFLPFLSLIILNLLPKAINKRISFAWASILSLMQLVLVFIPGCGSCGFSVIDSLSLMILFCIGIVTFVTLFVSRQFINPEKFGNFVNVILVALIGMNGAALARDVFTLYVYLEITAVASFILIALDKDLLGFEGAFKYLLMSAVASVLMISAIALLLILTGSTNFSEIHLALASPEKNNVMLTTVTIGIYLVALFIKSGLMPFHGWLPDAYSSAPATVSIFLAGIVTKVVGVYALIRVMISVLGFNHASQTVILLIGALSVILGALTCLTQSDFKRMLSYSSISQVGYIILGLGSGTPLGIAGATLHIFNHSIFKSLLFVNSAAVEKQTGLRDIDKMSGLAQKMPITGISSILGSLSAAGLPPLAGFWSKLIIIIALWVSGFYVYSVIAILGSILTLAYFLLLQRRVFFGKLKDEFVNIKEAGFNLAFPMVLLSVIIIIAGIFAPLILDKFILSFTRSIGG